MSNHLCSAILRLLAAISLLTLCAPPAPAQATNSDGYFKTPFQSESQFIIESIVSDLAEQMYYAVNHQLPDQKIFSVTATEKSGSPPETPAYQLQINLDAQHSGLKLELKVNGPIWSPDVYRELAASLAKTVGLAGGSPKNSGGTVLLAKLLDGTPETIEQENQALSDKLEKDFANPELHEEAALLLGSFTLREYAGMFSDIRSPLSRMSAHLAMARFLRGADSPGINEQMAEAIMLTGANDQTLALEKLKSMNTNTAAAAAMVRALQVMNTGDFRALAKIIGRSRVEDVAWFAAISYYLDFSSAWPKLDDQQKQTIDFVRVANTLGYSVETGHDLLQKSIPLELKEIHSIYQLSHHKELNQADLITVLNQLPEHCFSTAPGGETHVRVIGWGQWAMFLQRHLCHAVQQNFYFMDRQWSVHDDAKQFAGQCDLSFSGLWLYPFVQRADCADVSAYHKSTDESIKVAVGMPQLVPAHCWNSLSSTVPFAPLYQPVPDLHVTQWFDHNPPPGTDYDLSARWNYPDLGGHPGALARFERIRELAPYDIFLANCVNYKKYDNHPDFNQAIGLYQAYLPFSLYALRTVAATVTNQPDQYEKYMLQAAALDQGAYYDLGRYWLIEPHKDRDKTAQYYDKGAEGDPSALRVAGEAHWRVLYYLQKGDTNKAREIADFAGEVYSFAGLEAKAYYMYHTSNYDGALEWFAKIEERYGDSTPVITFCLRYKAETGDTKFDAELEKRVAVLFPNGKEKVTLRGFKEAPTDGMLIRASNASLGTNNLKQGDVIVAVKGVRVHNYSQYCYLRDSQKAARLDLIVWQGDAYHAVKATPPKSLGGTYVGFPSGATPDADQ